MVQNPEYDSTLEAAKQNILELIDRIKQKIITMEAIIDVDKRIIGEHVIRAAEEKIDYQLDRSDYDVFETWLETLKAAKEILEGIVNEIDYDTVIEKSIYVDKAQELLDIIEGKGEKRKSESLPERQDRLIKSNIDRFYQAASRRKNTEIRLEQLNKRLKELESRKEENKKLPAIVKNGFSSFMGRLFESWRDRHDVPYNKEQAENEIMDVEAQIAQADKELKEMEKTSVNNKKNADVEFKIQSSEMVQQTQDDQGHELQEEQPGGQTQGPLPHDDGNR